MGWCSGSYIAEDMWDIVREFIPIDKKPEVAKKIVDRFCDEDADDWGDGELVMLAHPEWFEK